MWNERDPSQAGDHDERLVGGAPDVHTFNVAPKSRTRETVAVIVTLAALFLLLFLFVGHPAAPQGVLHPDRTVHAGRSPH